MTDEVEDESEDPNNAESLLRMHWLNLKMKRRRQEHRETVDVLAHFTCKFYAQDLFRKGVLFPLFPVLS